MFTKLTPEATYGDPDFPKPILEVDVREHWKQFFAGSPDATVDVVSWDAISERLWVVCWILRGTNTRSFKGLPLDGAQFRYSKV